MTAQTSFLAAEAELQPRLDESCVGCMHLFKTSALVGFHVPAVTFQGMSLGPITRGVFTARLCG